MKRLTIKTKDGSVIQPDSTSWSSVFMKLAQYEDTGLEPDEVLAMMSGTRPQEEKHEAEWVTFKDEDGRFKKKCGSCGYQIGRNSKSTRFCPECGARMLDAV